MECRARCGNRQVRCQQRRQPVRAEVRDAPPEQGEDFEHQAAKQANQHRHSQPAEHRQIDPMGLQARDADRLHALAPIITRRGSRWAVRQP